jgi:hypothetical protein
VEKEHKLTLDVSVKNWFGGDSFFNFRAHLYKHHVLKLFNWKMIVEKKPAVATSNALVGLFAFILVATAGSALTMLFFTVSSATTRRYQASLIEADQLIIQANLTVLQADARVTLADTEVLQGIIVIEQGLVVQVSDLIDETNCRGVETINGVTPDYDNNRTFNLTGVGGMNVQTDMVETLYINASALQVQYNAQQTAIATLFDMLLAAQVAIEMLGMEVVKSVNHVLPDVVDKNINFTGACLTQVYGDGLGRVAIDYCDLIAFAQETFTNVSYDFTQVDMQLNQELSDMQTLLITANATVLQGETVQAEMITQINNVTTVGNNINITGGTGVSVSEGPGSQVVVRNEGLISVNGLTDPVNIEIVAGVGINVTEQEHGITLVNPFYIAPCTWTVVGLGTLWNIFATSSYQPLYIGWSNYSMIPEYCYDGTPILTEVGGIYGQFNMPPGIWTMDGTIMFYIQNGGMVQLTLQFRSVFYSIALPSVNFFERLSGTAGYYQHHFSLTLTDKQIPAGTQFSLQFTSSGTPTTSFVYYTEFNMTRIA